MCVILYVLHTTINITNQFPLSGKFNLIMIQISNALRNQNDVNLNKLHASVNILSDRSLMNSDEPFNNNQVNGISSIFKYQFFCFKLKKKSKTKLHYSIF